jgi:hypothetical protein
MSKFIPLLVLLGCDSDGTDLLPQYKSTADAVQELGELGVMSTEEFGQLRTTSDPYSFCAEGTGASTVEGDGAGPEQRCYFGNLGTPGAGTRGGATFSFTGTGTDVCVFVDPESVYWPQSVSRQAPNPSFIYPDNLMDDGDLDLFAGLSSYYTGSPGIEIGDFKGYYTDSLGNQTAIEYGACFMDSYRIDNAHSGRGTPEYCTIDTSIHQGVDYTVVLDTFATPLDDGMLSFAVFMVAGNCNEIGIVPDQLECTILRESLDVDGKERSCSAAMEVARCEDQLLNFCCANPWMCGEDPPEGICDEVSVEDFCASNQELCCDEP